MIKVYDIRSFSKDNNGGNPAGVVLQGEGLSVLEKQEIAAKVGYSETAFVEKSKDFDMKISYYTPVDEVDLCGHATVAAFSLLHQTNQLHKEKVLVETKAGIIQVEVNQKGFVLMDMVSPIFYKEISALEMAEVLNIDPQLFDTSMPIQVVSTGLRDIIVPIKSLQDLLALVPDMKKIEEISKKYDVTGLHVFTRETINKATAHCRNFAPLFGIPEESATGTANGALGAYLVHYGSVTTQDASAGMIFEQGYQMKLPSEIIVKIHNAENQQRVQVGGTGYQAGVIEI